MADRGRLAAVTLAVATAREWGDAARARSRGAVAAIRPWLLAGVLLSMVAVTPAAAQSGNGGLCGTPAIALFEWAAQTGAGVLFLGGLVYGGFKHARAGMSRDPKRTTEHRRNGTMAMIAGPVFGLVIVLGEQAAAAAGFNVAQCAQLSPWF